MTYFCDFWHKRFVKYCFISISINGPLLSCFIFISFDLNEMRPKTFWKIVEFTSSGTPRTTSKHQQQHQSMNEGGCRPVASSQIEDANRLSSTSSQKRHEHQTQRKNVRFRAASRNEKCRLARTDINGRLQSAAFCQSSQADLFERRKDDRIIANRFGTHASWPLHQTTSFLRFVLVCRCNCEEIEKMFRFEIDCMLC